jgi:hypothetical protein
MAPLATLATFHRGARRDACRWAKKSLDNLDNLANLPLLGTGSKNRRKTG